MRLALQIFRKDAERLRWAILLTLALLGYWTFRGATLAWGRDPRVIPFSGDNWLNLALPFAWAVLIALAIQEDSLVGDRQFWVALPCGWKPLLAAKALFAAVFIHVPYFVATVVILAARGFNPAAHLPHLLWKQVVLLALTIPAFGVATLVRNVAQFLLLAIAVASAVVLRVNDVNLIDSQSWVWDIRWPLAVIVVAIGGAVVCGMQFVRRSALPSRAVGVVIAIGAACLYGWIPRNATAAISVALSAAGRPVAVRLSGDGPARPGWPLSVQMTTVSLPLLIEGATGDLRDIDPVKLELATADGAHYDVKPAPAVSPAANDPISVAVSPAGPQGQLREDIYFTTPSVWERVARERVTLRGRMIVEFQQKADGAIDCRRSPSSQFLRYGVLECESVELGGRDIRIWGHGISEHQYSASHFPSDPWLSPIHRSQALFRVPDVPPSITPTRSRGFVVVDYTIPNVDLNQFVVRSR